MNARQVLHLWANQARNRKGELAARSGNVYFTGATCFSYGNHFPMASFVTNAKGERAVLVTSATYSNSTAKHLSWARSAIPDNVPTFFVPVLSVLRYDGTPTFGTREQRAAFDAYIANARANVTKAHRARTNGPYLLDAARECLANAETFTKFFGLRWKVPTFDAIGPNSAETAKLIQRAENAAKRERIARKKHEAERAENAKRDALENAERLAKWRTGVSVSLRYGFTTDENGSAYLRTQGDTVQTSQGAEVPLAHAVRVFRFVKACRMTGRAWEANGHTIRVGAFTFRSISAEGHATIGCHYLTWERILEWATAQGVADAEVSTDALEPTQGRTV